MARKPSGRPNGPPIKNVDWTLFEQLCALQCTQDEMAGFLHVCAHTLGEKVVEHYGESYPQVYKRLADSGKCSLRRNQFVLTKKNAAMAIWLGKNWLGQRDHDAEELKTAQMNPHLDILHQMLDENAKLKEKINALESQANQELPGSNPQVQHMGGGGEIGQDPCQLPETD